MLLANMKEPNIKVLTTKHVPKLEKLNNIVDEALPTDDDSCGEQQLVKSLYKRN